MLRRLVFAVASVVFVACQTPTAADDGGTGGGGAIVGGGAATGGGSTGGGLATGGGSTGGGLATGGGTTGGGGGAALDAGTGGGTGGGDAGVTDAGCSPATCMDQGFNCGMQTDGCGAPIDCGTCPSTQICGGVTPGVCYTVCTPKTCGQQSFNCGMQTDGCGTPIDCGTCPVSQTCGVTMPGVCGTVCTPKTCAQQGFQCGSQSDGCGGTIACGTCPGREVCGAAMAGVCDFPAGCTNLCQQQQTCAGTATTSLSGTVFAPNGTDPVPNVVVYVPNAPVLPISPGVKCSPCGSVSGSPLVSAVTGLDGKFTITDMPVGTNIPLVIQIGQWRRQFVIPTVAACVNTSVGARNLPTRQSEGDLPLIAFVTGGSDALECALRKIGIADSEFTNPSGAGRVRLYAGVANAGATLTNTPPESALWSAQVTLNQYDMVFFGCQGVEAFPVAPALSNLKNYANAGGRVFASHYGYVWLATNAPFSGTAAWAPDASGSVLFTSDPQTGFIDMTFPRGLNFAQWMQLVGGSSTLGQVPLENLRNDFSQVFAPSARWLSVNDPMLGSIPLQYTFDTPVGAPAAQQCGRVLFSDFHAEFLASTGITFPSECAAGAMTPQEKLLEYSIFDLGSCVNQPACTPKTCGQLGFSCGPQSDGCGNTIQCGSCPSAQTCGGGGPGVCGTSSCTPQTCAILGANCGPIGDGCGNTIQCGACPTLQVCGGGAVPRANVCGGGGA